MLTPDPHTDELTFTAVFADVALEQVRAAIGWPLVVAVHLDTIAVPSAHELDTLRALNARTQKAHAQLVRLPH
jgi:glutaconate CoA-transferase subunit B